MTTETLRTGQRTSLVTRWRITSRVRKRKLAESVPMADHRAGDLRIIDTNVLATANRHHAGAPPDCVEECAVKLQSLMASGHVVVDDGWRILGQYRSNVSGPGPGYEFLVWLINNNRVQGRCTQVAITSKPADLDDFQEMPTPLALPPGERIDPSDRMFLAVAAAHPAHPPILQATDSKWIGWETALQAHDIAIEWVCRDYAEATYNKKMTDRSPGTRARTKAKASTRRKARR